MIPRDGTMHLSMSPLGVITRLAAGGHVRGRTSQ
jgi:hypothetical protein